MFRTLFLIAAAFITAGCAPQTNDSPNAAEKPAIKHLTPEQAAAETAKPGAQFIDVRTPPEYQSGRAAGSINLPMEDIDKWISSLDKERPVLIICETGRRSQIVAGKLNSGGFGSVVNVVGGFSAWSKAGLPVEK